ncbi:SAF domain-containing protein [Nocardia arizonensis]|uniref:SAF domain-containing protein n=1 Tax=Nocardia arizonensis TaxID=1141647 RepID=UPI0006D08942|nr:SAF domain-containing protein [Nocardia arizonensis]
MIRSRTDLGRGSPLRAALDNRPPWADQLLVRRLLAAALTVTAIVLSLRGDPDTRHVDVVVAARDLTPGTSLSAADLRMAPRESGGLPDGTVRAPGQLLGATLTGAMRAGEIFTDLRTVGPRLAAAAVGARDARIVPLRLADTAVAAILRAGDRVDVIAAEETAGPGAGPARTLATDAAVVLVSAPGERRTSAERVVLVAMDSDHAVAVAAASLHTALTVVFH